jgi:hypothetical protein
MTSRVIPILRSLRVPIRSYVTPIRTYSPTTTTPPIKSHNVSTNTATGVSTPDTAQSLPSTAQVFPATNDNNHFNDTNTSANGLNGNGNGNGNGFTELGEGPTDWSKSYHGLSTQAFSKDIADILLAPVDPMDVEMKPGLSPPPPNIAFLETHSPPTDGLAYLPEIKYRRVLNKAFGPGAWGLAPRSETNVGPKIVSREYALVCQGRYVPPAIPLLFFSSHHYSGW